MENSPQVHNRKRKRQIFVNTRRKCMRKDYDSQAATAAAPFLLPVVNTEQDPQKSYQRKRMRKDSDSKAAAAAAPIPPNQVVITVEDSQASDAVQQVVIPVPDPEQKPTDPDRQDQTKRRFVEIPLNANFFLWLFLSSLSAFAAFICFECFLESLYHPRKGAEKKPFSWPLYNVIDPRLQTDYIAHGVVAFLASVAVCFYSRFFVNRRQFQLSQRWRNAIISSKAEMDQLFSFGVSLYLARNAINPDALIVYGLTGLFCVISSCLGFLLGPTLESSFQILTTVYTCTASYLLARSRWNAFYICVGSQFACYLLYVPFFLQLGGNLLRQLCGVLFGILFILIILEGSPTPAVNPT